MEWLYNLPLWMAGFLTVLLFAGSAVVGLFCFRHLVGKRLQLGVHTNESIIFFCSMIGVFYSLTVSLVAVAVWGTHSEVEGIVSQEAASLAALYRDISGHPDPTRSELRQQLRDYTRYVIEQSWPLQRRGILPVEEVRMMTTLQQRLFSFEPSTPGLTTLHAEALREFNELTELRQQRFDAVGSSLPGVMWVIVVTGAFLSVLASYFLVAENVVHFVLTGLMGAFIGIVVFVIAEMHMPLRGPLGVSPEAYQLVLDRLMSST